MTRRFSRPPRTGPLLRAVAVGCGTREGPTATAQLRTVVAVRELVELIELSPSQPRTRLEVVEGAGHDFGAFAARLRDALIFLLGPRSGARQREHHTCRDLGWR